MSLPAESLRRCLSVPARTPARRRLGVPARTPAHRCLGVPACTPARRCLSVPARTPARRCLGVPARTPTFARICRFSLGAFVVLVSIIFCSVFPECFHLIHLDVFLELLKVGG